MLALTCLACIGCDNNANNDLPPTSEQPPDNDGGEEDLPPVEKYITLTVGTYNICHCADVFNEYKVSPDKTAGILYRLGYDIVGLNEVYESGNANPLLTNQAQRLTKFSGLTYHFFGLGAILGDGCTIGNAVLSKYRLTDKQTIAVPIPENKRPNETSYYEDRVIVKTTVSVSDKLKIDYISIHAGINALEQENMVTALLELLDKTENPVIVCGDFNIAPENSRLKPLRERLVSAADVMGKTNEKTMSTAIQDVTADYVFLSKEFEVVSYNVEQIMTSDHFPIVVEVKIKDII